MFKYFLMPLLILNFCFATEYNPSVADLDTIKYYRDLCNDGDTINVPADTVTWTDSLRITKGIYFLGSGKETTVITSAYSPGLGEARNLIIYAPSDWSGNHIFRFSGFTIDCGDSSGGLYLAYAGNTSYIRQTNIIIDNNIFKNTPDVNYQLLTVCGFFGVAYDNTFEDVLYPIRFPSGYSEAWWNNWGGVIFGADTNNFYFEDNIFDITGPLVDCQYSNRYAFRYNDITANAPSGSYPLMDAHGNQPAGNMWASFGTEIYGNDITFVKGYPDLRGGKHIIFCNSFYATGGNFAYVKLREENCDSLSPVTRESAYPQKINDTYIWMNRQGVSGTIRNGYIQQNDCVEDSIASNVSFWDYNPSYNGTTEIGIGVGSALPDTGQVGDGYWVTNQDYSNLSNYIGVSPNEPLSGTLYKYVEGSGWTEYFTPLTYPHPLRGAQEAASGLKDDAVSIELVAN